MPTTLDSNAITTAEQELLRYTVQQAIEDRLGRAMTKNEVVGMEAFLTWVEAWKERAI